MSVHEIGDLERRQRKAILENRGRLTVVSVVMIALGLIAIFASTAATLATVLLFGGLLLVGGVFQIARAIRSRGDDFAWDLGLGVLYSLTGTLLVVDPVSGAFGLTLVMAAFFLLAGLLRLTLAYRLRRTRGSPGLFALTGLLDLVLGALILAGWPATGIWIIGLFVGIELLVSGATLFFLSRSVEAAAH